MGTIAEKLQRVSDTKLELRKALEKMGVMVKDEDTFRSYAEKFLDATPDTNYIRRYIDHVSGKEVEPVHIDDPIGGYTAICEKHEADDITFICPRIKFPEDATGTYLIPYAYAPLEYYTGAPMYPTFVIDYRNVEIPETASCVISVRALFPTRLLLPDCVDLVKYTVQSLGSRGVLRDGLVFGRSVHKCVSKWIDTTCTVEMIVYVPPGFKMNSGETLYLSRLRPTRDSLLNVIANLYDYAGNGDTSTRTISLGKTNLALLTEEEIATALEKGWVLS